MQIYLVGGAVRDTLLGLPVKDRDWVVVGATPQQLLAQGYTPVGRDFPVFLHPHTHEQYALARTERKTAPGYLGFAIHAAPDVTLEQDLARRDLTINALAVAQAETDADGNFDPAWATVVDPYGGRADLAARRLHHVTEAFREDPVRILRVARFAARYGDFTVAPDTLQMMLAMVHDGEAAALVSERVWQELAKGLMESSPSRLLEVLGECGALPIVVPELFRQHGSLTATVGQVLDRCAAERAPLAVRFASLCLSALPSDAQGPSSLLDRVERLCERLRVPSDCTSAAELATREHGALASCNGMSAEALVDLLQRCDAFRRPSRLSDVLWAMACTSGPHMPDEATPFPQRAWLLKVLSAAQAVSTSQIAAMAQAQGLAGPEIGAMVRSARVRAVLDLPGQ